MIITTTFVSNITNTSTADHNETWLPNYWSSFIAKPTSQQLTSYGVWLRLVGLPPVLVLGLVGNFLAILVMTRANMRRHSYSPYLVLLGICDSISLVVRLLFWINLLQDFGGRKVLITFTNLIECAAVEYVITANTVVCSWTIVCITYERVIVILFPLKGSEICTKSTSVKVVICLIVAPFLLLCYIPLNTRYNSELGCVMRFFPDLFIHYVMATTFVSMMPLVLILAGNIIIIISLKRQNAQIRGTGRREERMSRVTTMLVTVSVSFLILVLPNAVLALCLALRPDWSILKMASDPAAFLWDINFAINFYMYVITGESVRKEVRRICYKQKQSTVHSTFVHIINLHS